jgi:hypothetical protein
VTYKDKLVALLTPTERKLLSKLSTPNKIQDYLDAMPNNVLNSNEHTMRSPRRVIRDRKAHCMEGAMLAAAALAYHGRPPILLGLEATAGDYDHIVTLFKEGGRWGAISKTNYPVLRWRDPVYVNVRELVMSYFHEYFLDSGKKTLRRYSAPFNIQKYDPARWLTIEEDVDWLAEELGEARHFLIAPPEAIKKLRKASKIEIETTVTPEWSRAGKRLI